jgi:TP53 regulating kinase and related kinases
MQEVRSIVKARKLGVRTPVVYYVEFEANAIYMEKVHGTSLKDLLLSAKLSDEGTHD